MSWLRVDDGFAEHPKLLDVSDRAFRLHVTGLCYCARNLTDGILVMKAVKAVCAITLSTRKHIVELRDAELWIPLEDGFEIKDYLDYNPDSGSAKAVKEARRDAGRKGGTEKWRRERINQDMRQVVARRIGVSPGEIAGRACVYCDAPISVDWSDAERVRFLDADGRPTPELDHVEPLAGGGDHEASNLVLACLPCNRSKGASKPSSKQLANATRGLMPRPVPGPAQKKDQELDRPVGEQALEEGQSSLEARAAAEALADAIRPEHCDSGTRSVVIAYAQELSTADFRAVRRELVKRRGEIRNDGKWVNGALKKRAMERAA